jgi:hypothetical protein
MQQKVENHYDFHKILEHASSIVHNGTNEKINECTTNLKGNAISLPTPCKMEPSLLPSNLKNLKYTRSSYLIPRCGVAMASLVPSKLLSVLT